MPLEKGTAPSGLASALVGELAGVFGALLGTTSAATPSSGEFTPEWIVPVQVGPPTAGAVHVGMSRAECAAVARLVLGLDQEPTESAVADLLKEVVGQAVGALREKPGGSGGSLSVGTPATTSEPPDGSGTFYALELTGNARIAVGVWTTGAADQKAAEGVTRDHAPGNGWLDRRAETPAPSALPANLDVILDIDLPLSVRFGQTDMTLDALTRLCPGSVIDLGRSPDEPVELLVNGRLVARAEVVVVGGNYGVRILEVVSAADRVRSLAG